MVSKNIMDDVVLSQINLNYSGSDYLALYPGSAADTMIYADGKTAYRIQEHRIPLEFLRSHSSFTAIVMYLKSEGMNYHEIASMLNRDQRTIWTIYHRNAGSGIKSFEHLSNHPVVYNESIPIRLFSDRTLSILENVVLYLKTEYGFTFNEIAQKLGKNYQTIWTVYRRALKKLDDE